MKQFPFAFLLVLGIYPWSIQAAGLDPNLDLSQLIFEFWDEEDGLPQNSVPCIVHTQDGYVWFGTQEGLVRFDGFEMEVFNRENTPALSNSSINFIMEDSAFNLWIATEDGGIVCVKDGVFTSHTHRFPPGNHQVFYFFEASDGTLWIATYNSGLFGLRRDEVLEIGVADGLDTPIVWTLAEQPKGTIWIGTEKGLYRYRDAQLTALKKEDGLTTNQIWSLVARKDGSLWIGTSHGINILRDGELTPFSGNDQLPNGQVLTLMEDQQRSVWVGMKSGGLARICDAKIHTFSTSQGLPNPDVVSIVEGRDDGIWFGTDGGGLCHFRQGVIIPYSEYQGIPNNMVRSITADPDGTLWLATDGGGLARYHSGSFSTLDSSHGLSDDRAKSLCRDSRGGLWVGTFGGGINYLLLGQFNTFTAAEGLPIQNVGTIYEDRNGTIWVASAIGLIRYDRKTFRTFTTRDGLTSNLISNVFEDRAGTLWVGTRGGGLNYLRDEQFGVYTTDDGLSSNLILALHEDDSGNLWIGTSDHGLNRFADGHFSRYTKKDGLFDDKVLDIVPDDLGNFWMSSNKGIFCVRIQDLLEYDPNGEAKIPCRSFGTPDGMRSAECNGGTFPSATQTKDKKLWFPTIQGIVEIDPEKTTSDCRPPPVLIKSIFVDQVPQDLDAPIVLVPRTKKVEIRYTALCFSFPDRIRFQYRLEGHNEDWIDTGNRRMAFFTNLKPGSYTFRVRARIGDGSWNELGASASLQQQAHFFQQPWFILLGILFAVFIGIFVHRLQIRRIETRKGYLESLVGQRTQILEDINQQLRTTQEQVVEAARRAGMAEIASSVLGQVESYSNRIQEQVKLLASAVEESHGPEKIRELVKSLQNQNEPLDVFLDQNPQGRIVRANFVEAICAFPIQGKHVGTMVADIKRDVEQLTEIITTQQKYAKLEGTVDLIDINLLILDAIKFSKQRLGANKIRVSKELKPIPPFEGQKSNILKVLVCLVQHSCFAMSDNPIGKPRDLRMATRRDSTHIVIELVDTGKGFQEEELSRVFSSTASPEGDHPGLTLQACQSLIADLGGSLDAAISSFGVGTAFTVKIPFQEH